MEQLQVTTDVAISVVPANQATCDNLTLIFAGDYPSRCLEGYPMITQPGQEITWDELHVGSRSVSDAAGFTEVSHPTLRRVVVRIDF